MAEPVGLPTLEAGAVQLGLNLGESRIGQLRAYLDLLQKWNRVYNLTAVRKPEDMLTHHLLDSLAVVPALNRQMSVAGKTALDVGSGAGLPGVVLGVCEPALQVTCVDAAEKKMAFVRQASSTIAASNVRAVHGRVESLTGSYDLICSRAFASLPDFVSLTRHLLAPHGVWMAMKGKLPTAEMAQLPRDVEVFHVERVDIPGLAADRCLVWMRPVNRVT